MDEEQKTLALMPAMTMRAVMERRDAVVAFTRKAMKRGIDYGIIPGTGDKPTLLKPGAEKLCTLFGLSAKFSLTDRVEDWYGTDHGGEPMFYYIYKCSLYHGDWLVAEGEGSCNSHEKKYRYRSGERVCPKCGKANIRKSKQGGGWYCWAKLGGCGETFKAGDASIESQNVGQVANPDVADQVNTIQKMAQKRALIAATLLAVNASEFFTQDLDDMVIEGEYTKDQGPTWPAEPAAPEPPEPAGNGNGKAATESTEPAPETPKKTETVKAASLKYQPFVAWANTWAQNSGKDYARKDNPLLADMWHLLKRVGMLGFREVTEQNADDIKAALESHVRGKVDATQTEATG